MKTVIDMIIQNKKLKEVLLFAVLLKFLVGCAGLDRLAVGQTDRLKGAPFYKTYSKKISVITAALVISQPALMIGCKFLILKNP